MAYSRRSFIQKTGLGLTALALPISALPAAFEFTGSNVKYVLSSLGFRPLSIRMEIPINLAESEFTYHGPTYKAGNQRAMCLNHRMHTQPFLVIFEKYESSYHPVLTLNPWEIHGMKKTCQKLLSTSSLTEEELRQQLLPSLKGIDHLSPWTCPVHTSWGYRTQAGYCQIQTKIEDDTATTFVRLLDQGHNEQLSFSMAG